MKNCGCRIAGPLGVGAVLGETPVRKLSGPEGYYSVSLCKLHEAAEEMRDLLKTVPPINGSDAQTEMEWNWKREAVLAKVEGK